MRSDIKDRWQAEFQQADINTVRDLLSQEPGLVNVRVNCTLKSGSVRLWGPLYVASVPLRDLERVKVLVEAGADLDNSDLGTHWPSEAYEINAYLIEKGVDVNQASYLGFHAIGVTGMDTFFLMLENGLDPNFAWPYNGETPLHVQARDDDDAHLARAYELIKAGADVNAPALSGLDDAPTMDNEHFVRYGKETPLHFAARLGSVRQVRLLLAHGADPTLKTVSRMVEPQAFAEWTGDVTALMWPKKEFRRLLFEAYEGETPLDMARREGHSEITAILAGQVVLCGV